MRRRAGDETAVAFAQAFESFRSRDHGRRLPPLQEYGRARREVRLFLRELNVSVCARQGGEIPGRVGLDRHRERLSRCVADESNGLKTREIRLECYIAREGGKFRRGSRDSRASLERWYHVLATTHER